MAKKNTQQPQEQFKTMIGGQALIEGIMMLGPEKSAVVVRTKDGLQRKVEPRKLSQKWSPKKLPFIRGIFNFCTSMKTGVSALMYSADFFAEEDEDEKGKEPGRFEAWLEKRLSSEKAQNALITFSVVLGLAFSIALFFVLPSLLGSFLNRFVTTNEIVRNLLEGLLRIVIFLAYMFLVSRMKDMRRVFSYHGAEHKTIRCYEAKLPLTVENARKMTRLHPRCGTSFLFVAFLKDRIAEFDLVVLQLEIPMEINTIVAKYAHDKGVPVMLNPAPSAPLPEELLACLTYLSPNEHEARDLSGVAIGHEGSHVDEASVRAAAAKLGEKGVEKLLITIGSAGAALVEDGRFVLSPSVPGVKAIDPTAAGDSFVGAFCVAVCSGLSSEDALRFANHTAALTVSRLGAMPSLPTLAEVAATMPGGVSGLEG